LKVYKHLFKKRITRERKEKTTSPVYYSSPHYYLVYSYLQSHNFLFSSLYLALTTLGVRKVPSPFHKAL
jgi:hypothetical protein